MSNKQDQSGQIATLKEKLLEMDKLASLGTLSAGIMHEIQNPMNFILNFSRLSKDLIDELTEYVDTLDGLSEDERDEIEDISSMINENLARVVEHSDRASNIIQGMLAYSRGQKQEKGPIKVNELLAQFVNLGYHAMRANHKGFNVKITEDYDQELTEMKAIEHDLGRAVLNLVNNACYAVYERAQKEGPDYQPELTISTKGSGDHVSIKIGDNGTGIPASSLERIYQPFFSTKPEKSGTGLGLTITREIIEDMHQGKLEVKTETDKGTCFIITLPIK